MISGCTNQISNQFPPYVMLYAWCFMLANVIAQSTEGVPLFGGRSLHNFEVGFDIFEVEKYARMNPDVSASKFVVEPSYWNRLNMNSLKHFVCEKSPSIGCGRGVGGILVEIDQYAENGISLATFENMLFRWNWIICVHAPIPSFQFYIPTNLSQWTHISCFEKNKINRTNSQFRTFVQWINVERDVIGRLEKFNFQFSLELWVRRQHAQSQTNSKAKCTRIVCQFRFLNFPIFFCSASNRYLYCLLICVHTAIKHRRLAPIMTQGQHIK